MSDYLNFSTKTRDDLCKWIERSLGAPLITVELTKDHLEDCINESLEEYTKYVQQEREYLSLDLSKYDPTLGFTLPNYVSSVFALEEQRFQDGSTSLGGSSTLFSVPNQMFGVSNTWGFGGGIGGNSNAGSLVTYEAAKQFMDMTNRLFATKFYFEYNQRIKSLTLVPNPIPHKVKGFIVVGVNVIRPEQYQVGEMWVKRFALASAKVKLGTIRAKFSSVQLLGGGTIDSSIKEEGASEKEALREELLSESSVPTFFMG